MRETAVGKRNAAKAMWKKTTRREDVNLERAAEIAVSDPEVMHGTPVYRGTRIPIELIANMVRQGTEIDEILEGYPALNREKIALAPLYLRAFPRVAAGIEAPGGDCCRPSKRGTPKKKIFPL